MIVVTGRGLGETPATGAYDTQVLERERIVSSASGRIEDVLAGVAGFQQFRRSDSRSANPSAQGATLRALGGNASSRALVLLDGVPMADPFFGAIPFNAIDSAQISRVRVTRGGGSGPFGAGALAGTIELTSADAGTLGPVNGQIMANDRADSEAMLTLAPRLGGGFAVLAGRWDRGAGFWTTRPDQRVPASVRARNDAWSMQLRAVAPLSDTVELQTRALAYHDARTLRFAGADTTLSGQDASFRLVGRGRWQFDLLAYVQARNFTNVVVSSTSFRPTLNQRNTPATGIGGKFEVRPPVGRNEVMRLGADYRQAAGEMFETAFNAATGGVTQRRHAGGTNTDLGLFAEFDRVFGPLTLTAGTRADRYTISDGFYRAVSPAGALLTDARYPRRSGWETSVRAGALLRAGGGITLRGAGYTGLRLPTLNELYRPFTVFPVTTQANPALRNERLKGWEVGIDLTLTPGANLSLTAFDNRVTDAIANVTIGPALRQRQNIAAVHARGMEANGSLTRGTVTFEGSVAWTEAAVHGAGLDGRRPAQTPRLVAGANVRWHPADGWLLSASLRHTGTQFEDDLETDRLAAATTLDAYARIPLATGLAAVVRGENITNTAIVTRNQGGSIDLGTPRTVWVGITLGQ